MKVNGASGVPGETSNEVSGVVHGPSIQARQICGDVHIHQPPALPPGLLLGWDADLQAMEAARGRRLIASCLCRSDGRTPTGYGHPGRGELLRRRHTQALRAKQAGGKAQEGQVDDPGNRDGAHGARTG